MKNIFINLLSFSLLMVFSLTSVAQSTDSLHIKKVRDSIYWLTHKQGYYVADSLYKQRVIVAGKSLNKKLQQDSMVITKKKLAENYQKKTLFLRADSLKQARTLFSKRTDSVRMRQGILFAKSDSLRKLDRIYLKKSDSLHKLYTLTRLDTFHRYKQGYQVKLSDSLRKKIYLQKIKLDSQRIKEYLRDSKIRLRDTVDARQGLISKNLSMEITCNPGDTVFINNRYKKLIIKTIPSQKLRLSAAFFYKEELNEGSPETFKKLGIEFSRTNTSVTVMVNSIKQVNPKAAEEICLEDKILESNLNRSLLIELPENVIIVVNSRYGQTKIESFVNNLKADITNGSLKIESAGYANIKSNNSSIKASDINDANLNLSSTTFTASNIVNMLVVSNSSTINLDNSNSINMTSSGDNYKVEKAVSISGNKNFGKLQIESLKDQLVITGASADIKIDKLGNESPFIKIDNKYAEVKLPLYGQQNYAVNYEGSYNDVNKLSTASQKLSGMGSMTTKLSVSKDSLATIETKATVNKTKFEAVAGNITGKHTKVDIVCPYCNVVFN